MERLPLLPGTGAGIGKGIAQVFAREGAKVVAASRRAENGQPVVDGIVKAGGTAIFVTCDVSVEANVRSSLRRRSRSMGRWISW